jgi:hypothetical protein
MNLFKVISKQAAVIVQNIFNKTVHFESFTRFCSWILFLMFYHRQTD